MFNPEEVREKGGATRGGRSRHSHPRCRHSNPEEASEKGTGYKEKEEGEVSRVRRLEAGWSARKFGGIKSHRGH